MAELKDFTQDNVAALSDFAVEGPSYPLSPLASNVNMAAFTAAMGDPESVESTFRNVLVEMETIPQSLTTERIIQGAQANRMESSRRVLLDMLSDPNVSPEEKEQAALGFMQGVGEASGLRTMVAEQALIEDGGEEDNGEYEIVRLNYAEVLDEADSYRKDMQALINTELAKSDSSLTNDIFSFVEVITPFMEQGQLASIVNEFADSEDKTAAVAKAMLFMGDSREDVYNAIKKLPLDERYKASETLLRIIDKHKGIVLTDENSFLHAHNIRAFLETGYYNDFDQLVDNTVSLLDSTIIGAPLSRLVSRVPAMARRIKLAADARRAPDQILPVETLEQQAAAFRSPTDAEAAGTQLAQEAAAFKPSEEVVPDFLKPGKKPEAPAPTKLEEEASGFVGTREPTVEEVFGTRVNNTVVESEVSPVSISQIFKDTNATKARALNDLAGGDLSGEVAHAAYGSSRTEALANDALPQIADGVGSTKNKVADADANYINAITPDPMVRDFHTNTGAIFYTPGEKARTASMVVNDFENVYGMTSRKEMFTVEALDAGVRIGAVYGPKNGGFIVARDAADTVKFLLRNYGVDDTNISILANIGGRYERINPKNIDNLPHGDYLVGVNYDYRINPADIAGWDELDVKRNFFDIWIPPIGEAKGGSLQRHLVDPQSMLHPVITKGAAVQVDRAVALERSLAKLGETFSKKFAGLNKADRIRMERVIKEFNEQGIKITDYNLRARGFNDKAIDIMRDWKRVWDNVWWLENRDFVKSLRSRGYQMFTDKTTGTELIAKPRRKQDLDKVVDVYDYNTGNVVRMSADDIDRVYNNNGTIAQTATPVRTASGDSAKYVISLETPSNYLRSLRDDSIVLNYRDGYYQVQYNDPRFIYRETVDANGNKVQQVVATTETSSEARLAVKRFQTNDPNSTYGFRRDIKGDVESRSRGLWEASVSAGRTAQRVRGQRLEDATSRVTTMTAANLADPVEALTRSIRSIARRASMREYIEASKARFINQYADVLPVDEFKNPRWPDSIKEIGKPGEKTGKFVGDARTTFEYIRYIENGYVNSIDDVYKAALNGMADLLGKYDGKVAQLGERGAQAVAEGRGPTQLAKSLSFKLYLALNPLRQLLIQSHQSIRLAALFPTYTANPNGLSSDLVILAAGMRGIPIPKWAYKSKGMTKADADRMVNDFKRSGLAYSVDANNLVRGDLQKLADMTFREKLLTAVNAPVRISQRIGFDLGEQTVMATAWLAYRDEALKAGKKLTQTELDHIAGNARNITYNMNFAGDMPYNQNMLNLTLQFMQVPHKAMLQPVSNRVLSRADRGKLLAFDTIMWGVPTISAIPFISKALPEDPELRRSITHGLEDALLNWLISTAAGDETAIDFGDLAPGNAVGIYDTLYKIWTDGSLSSLITQSPSGQLLFGSNPRMTNAFKAAARYFSFDDDFKDVVELSDVFHEFASLSSGYSNAFKAIVAKEYQKKYSSSYSVSDTDATTPEAMAQLFGFRSIGETQTWEFSSEVYEKSKSYEDDVNQYYKDLKRYLGPADTPREQRDHMVRVMSQAWRAFDTPRARQIIARNLERDYQNGDNALFRNALRTLQFMPVEDTISLVEKSYPPGENRTILLDTLNKLDVK